MATAGDYISQTADSFGDYLQMYEQSCTDLAENSDNLMEYDDRTLYSIWDLSLKQVAAQDPEAAKLVRLMEYLGNTDLWYELFRKGAESAPGWFCNITKSKARFNKVMATLHGYSLIEAIPGYYSLHACVYNWVLEYLIGKIDIALFGLAMHCVAQNVAWESTPGYWVVNSRTSQSFNNFSKAPRALAVAMCLAFFFCQRTNVSMTGNEQIEKSKSIID